MNQQGYNDTHLNNSLTDFLIPSKAEAILLFLGGLLLIALGNTRLIWQAATSDAQVDPQTVSQTVQPHFDTITTFLHRDIIGQATVLLVWAAIGSLAYMLVWGGQQFAHRAKADVEESEFVQPITKEGYWHSKVAHYLFLICAWFVLGVAVIMFFTVVLPLATGLGAVTILGYQQLGNYQYLVFAVIILMLSLFSLSRLWKAARYTYKISR